MVGDRHKIHANLAAGRGDIRRQFNTVGMVRVQVKIAFVRPSRVVILFQRVQSKLCQGYISLPKDQCIFLLALKRAGNAYLPIFDSERKRR